jgi:hypothetical protein
VGGCVSVLPENQTSPRTRHPNADTSAAGSGPTRIPQESRVHAAYQSPQFSLPGALAGPRCRDTR